VPEIDCIVRVMHYGIMTARFTARRNQVASVTAEIADWARRSSEVRAVALVGSYARGQECMSSDIDVLLLAEAPDYITESG